MPSRLEWLRFPGYIPLAAHSMHVHARDDQVLCMYVDVYNIMYYIICWSHGACHRCTGVILSN